MVEIGNLMEFGTDFEHMHHSRVKRALGNDLSEITLHMIEKASQTISSTEVNLGDSFTFEAVLDLPRISIENKSDLNIEIFSLDPEEAKRDVNNDVNRIQFQVPVHVLNIDSLTNGITSFIVIGSPLEPVGARVIRTGTVAYFPPEWTVTRRTDNAISHNFGLVKNVDDTNPTTVVLEAAFAIQSIADDSSGEEAIISVGGETLSDPTLFIDIESNPNPNDVTVAIEEYGFDNKLYLAGQAAFDMIVHIPSQFLLSLNQKKKSMLILLLFLGGSGSESLHFEAVPDFDVTDFSLRLCRASIINIGKALPCVRHSDTLLKDVYSKSDDTKPFNDFGNIDVGRTCPLNYPSTYMNDNSFTASLVYELPRGQSVDPGSNVRISGGVRLGNNTIWVSSMLYEAQNTPMGPNIITSLNFNGDIILMINNTHYDEDHVLLEVCDIAVVKVGENLPCLDVTKDVIKEYGTESKMIGSDFVHSYSFKRDIVTIDLGYVMNTGFTKKQKNHNASRDDRFAIEVEVQMSDHVLATNGSSWNVALAVKFGEIVVVANKMVNVLRSDAIEHDKGNLNAVLALVNEDDTHRIKSEGLTLEEILPRMRAGYMIDDVVVNMTEIARQTLGEEEMNIGDSITFNMEIDFPGLAISEKTDLVIEIFGLKPDTGIAGFHICQAHMIDPRGSNIKAIQEYPHYTETNMHEFPNLVEKTRLQFQQVHTNNISDLVNNKIGVQFQAVMVPSPGMVNGEDYYITAGAEYGEDTYVWIYEAKVELKNPPTIISKGSSALFVIEAFITDPAVSIDFGTFQPLGYSDLFHIGQITFETGNAFACSDPKFWKDKYLPSPTELSVVNASLSYPMLINREADRLVTEEKNKMVFYVPIHVLNVDTVSASKVRNVAFGLKIGNSKLWTALHENNSVPISFEADDIGWDDKFYVHGQAALNVRVTIPSTAGKNDLYLEAVPDFDQTEVSAWICQLRILEVGFGLPCLRHRIRDNLTNFNRSHTDRPFYDFASLYLGQTCPMRSIETPDDNDFLVQIVYELPPQESITTGCKDYRPAKMIACFKT
ncbi:hypothetical protein TCAL_11101 [Tigriopus californicus]|uniref:Uncharacterized protein n=1 Tax=Tigriopus californicus TaxID=6832 RepID=A0A553NZW1_TIGCA|nr:hypothetical protein TCAL_11101 [Tigriopus californicus]